MFFYRKICFVSKKLHGTKYVKIPNSTYCPKEPVFVKPLKEPVIDLRGSLNVYKYGLRKGILQE
jgi:hypothetical protein